MVTPAPPASARSARWLHHALNKEEDAANKRITVNSSEELLAPDQVNQNQAHTPHVSSTTPTTSITAANRRISPGYEQSPPSNSSGACRQRSTSRSLLVRASSKLWSSR